MDELITALTSSSRVAVPGLGGMAIASYNESVYLHNDRDSPLTVKQGAHFHKGKWVNGLVKLEEEAQALHPFLLEGFG